MHHYFIILMMGIDNKKALILEAYKYYDDVYTIIRIKAKYDSQLAEDVCQAAYKKAIEQINDGKYIELGSIKGWIFILAKNTLIDIYRKRNRKNVNEYGLEEDSIYVEDEDNFFDKYLKEEQLGLLKKAILSLPVTQQEIIDYIIFKDYRYVEVAEITGVSIGTLLARMSYAIKNLRKLLKVKPISNSYKVTIKKKRYR